MSYDELSVHLVDLAWVYALERVNVDGRENVRVGIIDGVVPGHGCQLDELARGAVRAKLRPPTILKLIKHEFNFLEEPHAIS